MAERPTGTVTFLFTDIEGSTRLLRELGPQPYAETLEDHGRLIRRAIGANGGYEVDTQGDAFFVAFGGAQDAVRAAREAQLLLNAHAWPADRPVRVRMGIHTAESAIGGSGYVGVGVHRAARICAAGHGGQVLLSLATRSLLADEDPPIALRDLGEHRLKDLTEPQRLFQLLDPDLASDFPALRTLENRPTNLPVQATPLVGRERELAEVVALVRRPEVRLATLTGPGGTGKTRLALQAAADLLDDFPNGVYFVGLAAVTDPDLVLPSVAQVLGVSEAAGQSLEAYLAAKSLLLVIDNLEQVVGAGPGLAKVLSAAPGVKVIATSREALRVAAERVFPVPPLELPDPRHLPEPAALSRYEAVALFLDRAQAVDPGFAITGANAPAVAEICVRLDGLPLALELAAARIPLLGPDAMLKRLGAQLTFLTAGARDLPARQQTLRATLAWSHDLLGEPERRLFARLGIFAGGFGLEAAEAVCDADLETLGSLLEKSLLRHDGERFTMLETVREYAVERLAEGGEATLAGDRHAAFFEALAEGAYGDRFGHEAERLDELEREHDNLRAALERLAVTDPARRVALAGALGWFWHVRSHFAEGREQLAAALGGTAGRDPARARALAAAGELAAWSGDVAAARPLIDEAVGIWRELGRDQEVAWALHELGWGYFVAGDDAKARALMEESLELQHALGGDFLIDRAQVGLLQALVSIGDIETVERLAPETLERTQRSGDLRSEHFVSHFLGDCALIAGDPARAQVRYLPSLEAAVRLGDRSETSYEVQGLAMASAGLGHARRALRLAGAADAEQAALGIDLSGVRFWIALLDRYLEPARRDLGPDAARAAWEEGRRMGFERAIEEAREAPHPSKSTVPTAQ